MWRSETALWESLLSTMWTWVSNLGLQAWGSHLAFPDSLFYKE